jgi:uncharacterized protein YbjT (DUF2867 family)
VSANQAQQPILVVGGTGKTGRRVADRLTARRIPVRIGSRTATPPFSWEDPSTWGPAFRGARSAYITYYPDLAVPGSVEAIAGVVDQALENGVRRLVLLSGRGEEEAERCERVLQESGADWTILRCTWFAQNFSESYLLDGILQGELALPAGSIPEPFLDADDIADVAVAALTEPGHVGQVYELTGPRLLTFAQAVEEISRASGRAIRYREISPERYAATLGQQGVPEDVIWLLNYLFTTVLDGRNARLADGVQRALGRAPRDFAQYARDAATTGVWASGTTVGT